MAPQSRPRATTSARSPKARHPRKRCVPSSEGSAMRSGPPWSQTLAGLLPPARRRVREGNRGTSLSPARPAHTPQHRLFGSATPEPEPRLRRRARAHDVRPPDQRRQREEPLDKQGGLDLSRAAPSGVEPVMMGEELENLLERCVMAPQQAVGRWEYVWKAAPGISWASCLPCCGVIARSCPPWTTSVGHRTDRASAAPSHVR